MALEPELEEDWRGCIFTIQQQVFQFLTIHNVLMQKELQLRKEAEIRKRRVHRHRRKVVALASQALLMNPKAHTFVVPRPIRKVKIKKPRSRPKDYWEVTVKAYSDAKFKEVFRINRKTFEFLLTKLSHMKKEPNSRGPIAPVPLPKRVAVPIYAMGNPGEYAIISKQFKLARTTVCQFIRDFCIYVCANLQDEYLNAYPPTEEKVKNVVEGFRKLGLPQCYGAINYIHFELRVCKGKTHNLENSEGYGSVVFLAAVDSNKRFTYIDAYGKGSETANDLFQKSALKQEHLSNFANYTKKIDDKNIPIVLVGDESFQLTNILLKPYSGECSQNLSTSQEEFNRICKNCLGIVEETFDQLIARFRRFGRQVDFSFRNISSIIKTCAILHNICLEQEDDVLPDWIEARLNEKKTASKSQPKSIFSGEDSGEGIETRDLFCSVLENTQNK